MPGGTAQTGETPGQAGPNGSGRDAARPRAAGVTRLAMPGPAPDRVPASPAGLARVPVQTAVAARRLAPRLGLDPDAVPLRVADTERGPLGRSLAGATEDAVYLRPSALLRPDVGLLVHELAHLAQHRNRTRPSATAYLARTPGPDVSAPDVTSAEAEAAALAAAAVAGRELWAPRAVLPEGHLARLEGAVGVAPASTSSARPGVTPAVGPSPFPADQCTDLAAASKKLDGLVSQNHAAELARMRNVLGDIWELDKSKRELVLGLLDPQPFVVARAMVRALDAQQRRLLALVEDVHHRAHPRSAVAVLAALYPDDVAALGDKLTKGWEPPLHGVDTSRLDPPALRGLYDVLNGQSDEALQRLVGADRRQFFRELLNVPVTLGDELADIETALAVEWRTAVARYYSLGDQQFHPAADLELVTHVRELLRDRNAEQARKALSALEPLAMSAAVESPVGPAAANQGTRPSDNAPVQASERLRVVVTELDAGGLIDAILDNLPEADRYGKGPDPLQQYGAVLATVLAARAPTLTLERIEKLLSYVITDADARFAYFLVRTLPLAEQDRWRRRDDAKWFHRLEDNLPKSVVTEGEYTGVGSEYLPTGPAMATPEEVNRLLGTVLKTWRLDESAAVAYAMVRLFTETLEPALASAVVKAAASMAATSAAAAAVGAVADGALRGQDRDTRMAVVRRLDTLGVLNDILKKISDDDITSEAGRHAVDRLAALRDPVSLQEHATKLLGWPISVKEAWLAFLLLRSLPPAEQAGWDRDHPGKWADMMGAMTPQLRQSEAVGALTGRDGFPALADLHERISDKRLWDGQHNPELRALIIMAYAADDRRWVFELSRSYADLLPKVGPDFVSDLGLYDPVAGRASYTEEHLNIPGFFKSVPGFFEELGRVLSQGGEIILFGGGLLLEVLRTVGKRTISMSVDLDQAQKAMGGDLSGARVTDRQRTIVGGTVKDERDVRDQTNRLEIHLDPGSGAFRARLPKLALSRLNISRPGASYRTGHVELTGLEISGDFSDRHYSEPIGFDFAMERADVRDLVIANEAFGAVALAQLVLSVLRLQAGATGAEDLAAHPPRPGTIGIPIFGPLLQAIDNLTMLLGGLPFPLNYSLTDIALLPFSFGAKSWLVEHAIEYGGGELVSRLVRTARPADLLYGLASDGTLRPPRSVPERLADAVRMLRSLSVSFSDLTITGASFGAKAQVASIHVHDVTIAGARSLPSHLRNVIQSLNRRIPALTGKPRAEAEAQRDAALEQLDRLTLSAVRIGKLRASEKDGTITAEERGELAQLVQAQDAIVQERRRARQALGPGAIEDPAQFTPPTEAELRMEELERKDRWIAGSLKQPEREELAKLSTLLRSDVGAVLDIGGIQIGPVSGAVELTGAKVGPIHLDARVPDALLPQFSGSYLADPELIAKFRARMGKPPDATELLRSGQLNLNVAGITLQPDPSGVVLRLPPGKLPSYAELQTSLAALPEEASEVIRSRLTLAVDLARQMEGWQSLGGYNDKVLKLAEAIRRLVSVEVAQLSVEPIKAGFDPKKGITVEAGFEAKGIAGPHVIVDRITGRVEAGATFTAPPGMTGVKGTWSDWLKTLRPWVNVDLNLENVRTTRGSATNIDIKGLGGTVEVLKDGVHVPDLHANSITIGGLDLGTPSASITGQSVRLETLRADLTYLTTGQDDDKTIDLHVTNLTIDKIFGEHLVYATSDKGTQLRAELVYGALGDIRASNIAYRQSPGRRTINVDASVGTIYDLRYEAVRTLLSGPGRANAVGTLTGQVSAAGPGTTAVGSPVVTAGFALDKTGRVVNLDAKGLKAADAQLSTPTMTIRRLPIDVHLQLIKDEKSGTEISGEATLNDLEIGAIRWHSGTTTLTSAGGSRLGTVHIKAAYHNAKLPWEGRPRTWLDVKAFDIDDIDVADLHYVDEDPKHPESKIDLQLGSKEPHPGALRIKHIHLFDFNLPLTDEGLDISKAAVRGEITGFHLEAQAIIGAIRGAGEINAGRITVGLAQGGRRITARGRDIGASLSAKWTDPGQPAAKGRKAELPMVIGGTATTHDADTGDITITPEAIEIEGMRLPDLDLTSLYITFGGIGYMRATGRSPKATGPGGLEVTSETGSGVHLHGVETDLRIGRRDPRKITVNWLKAEYLDAEGMMANFPGLGKFILPPRIGENAPLARLKNITVGGLEITSGAKGLAMTGSIHVESGLVERVRAEVAGKFTGDVALSCGTIDVDLLPAGLVDIRVQGPHADLPSGAQLDSATANLKSGAVDAEYLHYRTGIGLELTRPRLSNLVFKDTARGIDVSVKAAYIPELPDSKAPPRQAKITSLTSGRIPELMIEDAKLELDFTKRSSGSGSSSGMMTPTPRELLGQVLDGLQGSLAVILVLQRVYIPLIETVGHQFVEDIHISVDVMFDNGTIDLEKLRQQAQRSIKFDPPHTELSAGSYLLSVETDTTGHHAWLALAIGGIKVKNLLHWYLKDPSAVERFRAKRALLVHDAYDSLVPDDEPGGGPGGISLSLAAQNLSAKTPKPVSMSILSGDPSGSFSLEPDVATGLSLSGTIFPQRLHGFPAQEGKLSNINLEKFQVRDINLMIGPITLRTGNITVEDAKDGSLTMDETSPKFLSLTISRARASNIVWRRFDEAESGGEGPTAAQ